MTNIWQKKGDEGTNIALLCANHRLFKGQGSHTLATNRKRERVRHWVSGWVGRRGREQAPSVGIVQPIWLLCTKSYSVGRGWGSSTQVSRSANRNSKSNLAGGGLGGGGNLGPRWFCLLLVIVSVETSSTDPFGGLGRIVWAYHKARARENVNFFESFQRRRDDSANCENQNRNEAPKQPIERKKETNKELRHSPLHYPSDHFSFTTHSLLLLLFCLFFVSCCWTCSHGRVVLAFHETKVLCAGRRPVRGKTGRQLILSDKDIGI